MHQLDLAPQGLPRIQTIANSVCTSRRPHVDKQLPILYLRRDAPAVGGGGGGGGANTPARSLLCNISVGQEVLCTAPHWRSQKRRVGRLLRSNTRLVAPYLVESRGPNAKALFCFGCRQLAPKGPDFLYLPLGQFSLGRYGRFPTQQLCPILAEYGVPCSPLCCVSLGDLRFSCACLQKW